MVAVVAGSGAAVLVSPGAAWAALVRAGKAGHLSPLGRTLGESSGASWLKMNVDMACKRVRAASWASLMVSLTLVASLGAVGPRVGPCLWQLSDW